MPYQRPQTPRFYCNVLEWLAINRVIKLPDGYEAFFKTPLDKYKQFPEGTGGEGIIWNIENILQEYFVPNCFLAILGHNLGQFSSEINGLRVGTGSEVNEGGGITAGFHTFDFIVNSGEQHNFISPSYNGFSIWDVVGYFDQGNVLVANPTGFGYLAACSFILGTYHDMPHSPDLNVKISREMDGVKHTRTLGGNSLVKNQYLKAPTWIQTFSPWELGPAENPLVPELARNGRRVWDISYTLKEADIFPDNLSLTNYETSGYEEGNNQYLDILLNSNTFYSQVLHRTNLGQLPFLFNASGGGDAANQDNSPQNFAICKFDMESIKLNQIGNGIYHTKMKIREIW